MNNNDICVQTTRSMSQLERDNINRKNTLPNNEQTHAAHRSALGRLGLTAKEKRAHIAECAACSGWLNS